MQKRSTDTEETNDKQKYDKARYIPIKKIEDHYKRDWESETIKIRQRGVILYIINKLALRPGYKGEKSNTTGCCSLRKKHLKLHKTYGDDEFVVEFDFLGKCSIPYHTRVQVEKKVFENLQDFLKKKSKDDYVFDKINTPYLNKYLKTFMDGLTARVFRTYRACQIMQKQLTKLTRASDTETGKIQSFKEANNKVAEVLNHQRKAKKETKSSQTKKENKKYEVEPLTSIMFYIDPRIVIAWCKKWDIQIEKIYTKCQQTIFSWAMTAAADYTF